MARPTYWLRSGESFEGGSAADTHDVRLGIFAPGETITRVRFKYFTSSYAEGNPTLDTDIIIAAALDVSEDPDLPRNFYPATSPSEDWMWWEGDTQHVNFFYQPLSSPYLISVGGPLDRSERDVKAQRKNTGEDYWSLWLKTQSFNGPGQGVHWLGYSASVLVLTAP